MIANDVRKDRTRTKLLALLPAILMALCVFAADVLSSLHGAIAVLYTTVILMVARTSDRRVVFSTGLICGGLALLGWINMHWGQEDGSAALRLLVSLTAIGITTVLSLRNNTARGTLSEQARILELTHDTVIIRNSDDEILYWNEGAEKLYGWTRAEALGQASRSLLSTEFGSNLAPALEHTGTWSGEIIRKRKNGERILLASRWLDRLDQDGRSIGVIETSADITEAQRTAKARRQSEERYRSIFNAAGFPIWETDLTCLLDMLEDEAEDGLGDFDTRRIASQAVVQNANDAAGRLFGLADREALIGMSTVSFYPPDQAANLRRIWTALHQGHSPVEQEAQILTADGRTVDILVRVTLPEGDDPWRRVLVMAVDVTDLNRAQTRLAQAQAELTHVARVNLLGQLAASIAHEVNQPLSAIITYAKSGRRWLKREAEQAYEVENCLDHIVSNGVRAADVISRVRAMASKSEPQHGLVDLPGLLEETITLLHRDLHSNQVVVNVTVPSQLPPVYGDRVQIQQVLMNLLLNAEQAMGDTPFEDRRICVSASTSARTVDVEVTDCGAGIEGDPEMLFRPFYTTKTEGMGMGLSICRSIVEQHGGTLTAANAGARGAAFRFTLPIADQTNGDVR